MNLYVTNIDCSDIVVFPADKSWLFSSWQILTIFQLTNLDYFPADKSWLFFSWQILTIFQLTNLDYFLATCETLQKKSMHDLLFCRLPLFFNKTSLLKNSSFCIIYFLCRVQGYPQRMRRLFGYCLFTYFTTLWNFKLVSFFPEYIQGRRLNLTVGLSFVILNSFRFVFTVSSVGNH